MQSPAVSRFDNDRTAGVILCLAAAATVLAMAHHPTSAHGMAGDGGDFVHGAMIVLLGTIAACLFHFARRRGLDRLWILAGVVAYAISLALHIGAATLNGFVVPALAARGPGAVGHDAFVLAWEANQALARLGVYATGAAYLLWSLDFLHRPGLPNRLIGVAGVLAAVGPASMLYAGVVTLNVSGAFLIYAVHVFWIILVGVQLIRRQV